MMNKIFIVEDDKILREELAILLEGYGYLCDEPTGTLDSKSAKMLLECFRSLNEKFQATILMVAHEQ